MADEKIDGKPHTVTNSKQNSINTQASSESQKRDAGKAQQLPETTASELHGDDLEIDDEEETDDDEGNEDDEDGESFDDSDSLLNDIIAANDQHSDGHSLEISTDVCTPAESKAFRTMLHRLGPDEFIRQTISSGTITAKKLCTAFGISVPMFDGRPDEGYYRILGIAITRELQNRQKLDQYNTIDDVASLLKECRNILVITGAGISTNLGVPDFRSKETGFYAKMSDKFDDPQEIFDIEIFDEDPSIFFENSAETLPAPGKTSPTHAFIKLLETEKRLLTNYTQNIDNVEGNIGISPERLIQCHGSWATFTCRKCSYAAPGLDFYDAVKAKQVPRCPQCTRQLAAAQQSLGAGLKRKRPTLASRPSSKSRMRVDENFSDGDERDGDDDLPEAGVMKPNITFFGEKLPDIFFERFTSHDRNLADLVLVIGTSMTVAPVSEIPQAVPPDVPVVYISRDRARHVNFDVVLLGDCDVVCAELAARVGWTLEHPMLPADRRVKVEAADEHRSGVEDGENTPAFVWKVERIVGETAPAEGVRECGNAAATTPNIIPGSS